MASPFSLHASLLLDNVSSRSVSPPQAQIFCSDLAIHRFLPAWQFSPADPGTQVGTDKIIEGFFGETLLELASADVTWSGGPDLVVPLFVPPLLKSEGGKPVFITEGTSNLGTSPAASRDLRPTLVGVAFARTSATV